MAISDYSTTAASNTTISGINIGESCDPGNINNAIRQMMEDIAVALDWGAYTPTLTNTTNLDASTAYPCQWVKIGGIVIVSGRVDIDPAAASAATSLGISLPVASDFANSYECSGTANVFAIPGQSGSITADTTNNRATLNVVSGTTGNQGMTFIFMYQVL